MNMQTLKDLKNKAFSEAEKVCPDLFSNTDPVLRGRAAVTVAVWWDGYYEKSCAVMYTHTAESMDKYVDFLAAKYLGV